MTTLIQQPILGLEQIQREGFLLFFDNLNESIAQINEFMAPQDEALAIHIGRDYERTDVEDVAPENFHEGHRPSLINAAITQYPNLSVWSVRATPTPDSASLDQQTAHRILLFVEIMVKSEKNEEEVNRRILRTVEAVNLCVMSNQTFNGTVYGMDTDPSVEISEVFTRKERSSYGPEWFWQGARLEYAVRKEAVHPSSTSGSIFRTATPDAGQSGIDYSQFIDQG